MRRPGRRTVGAPLWSTGTNDLATLAGLRVVRVATRIMNRPREAFFIVVNPLAGWLNRRQLATSDFDIDGEPWPSRDRRHVAR